jgi:chaperonin GroES
MNAPLQPLGMNIVAQNEAAESKTASGLYLPENAQEKPKTAKVVAIGNAVSQLKVGDRIVFKSYTTTEVKIGKEDYIILKEEDVLATVK